MKLFLILILFTISCQALPFISSALGSHMVLQRAPDRAKLWGWTSPGQTVFVFFNGKNYTSVPGPAKWVVTLDPTIAGGPYTITVRTSDNSMEAVLSDVMFGDVYICSGQSNMQFATNQVYNAEAEVEAAINYPLIRLFTVGQGNYSSSPLDDLVSVEQGWSVATPQSVGNNFKIWTYFSAVCWFFGKSLQDNLDKTLPIGLVSSNWGGTIIQTWSSPQALSQCPQVNPNLPPPNQPSLLWNSMIVPLLPMTIKGAVWYQGEGNADSPTYYCCAFPAMINDWRQYWGIDFPFFFVQLAPYTEGAPSFPNLPETRATQECAFKVPKVGMAVTIDAGDVGSPYGNIHPRDKKTVGTRLALAALSIVYQKPVQYWGPVALKAVLLSTTNSMVEVSFVEGTVGSKLQFFEGLCPPGISVNDCGWYQLFVNNVWKNATVAIGENQQTLVLALPGFNSVPSFVSYGWANWPVASLYNEYYLPAGPFLIPISVTI
eukprot:TRINITY_DN10225_c0_g1_i1.p1 TRINITY_DN10225_c0_g1~~TRINITY_DN10225_c0_g1_i1.p1  ORF type:complete len:488 (-),score=93.08 TRINITY_DN10225_c0_g1_i1:60-1523(-)